ncbi:MAG TPA: NapC/NirT family cytochrome c [Ramlibacter sp.]|jgi:cytochrome c-type protein NapC
MSIPSTDGSIFRNGGSPGFLRRFWARLNRPSRFSFLAVSTIFFVGGVLFWGGFHTGVDMTNTLEFCTTCHEMRDTVYQEYKQSVHYSNRAGIRAICSDCHVPREWSHMMVRKMQASLELWGKVTGTIDTRDKFEARRMQLALHEWERLQESNSRECRNCHAFDAMSPGLQKPEPYKIHMQAREEGKTCIDCHKGLAHKLPKGYNILNQ